jgi:hypothetical protein
MFCKKKCGESEMCQIVEVNSQAHEPWLEVALMGATA